MSRFNLWRRLWWFLFWHVPLGKLAPQAFGWGIGAKKWKRRDL